MASLINSSPAHPDRDLLGQTVLVIGGSSGPRDPARVIARDVHVLSLRPPWLCQELTFAPPTAASHPGDTLGWPLGMRGFRRPGRRYTLC